MERRYEFEIILAGFGKDWESAWDNALESFVQDPGNPGPDQVKPQEIGIDDMPDDAIDVRCIVAGRNSNGEPDLYFVIVNCNTVQYENGDHYEAAREQAVKEGYEAYLAFDELDPAGTALLDKFQWDTATVIDSLGKVIDMG